MRRLRTWCLVVVASTVLVTACIDQSPVDPDAVVRVGGRVLDPDGAPMGDRPVRMGTGVSVADGTLGVLTVGLSCVGGGCQGDIWDTTTDGDGAFAFEITGSDTRSSFGEARSTLVSASAAPVDGAVSGASASARFRIRTELVDLPVLGLVDPGLDVEGGPAVRAAWRAAAPGPYELRFEEESPVAVWSTTVDGLEAAIDPRVLEGTAGRVVLAGGSADAIEGSEVALQWRSPGRGYASRVGPAPSRGRSCAAVAPDGAVGPSLDACGLTDGDLIDVATLPSSCPEGTACAEPVAVQLSLGSAVPAELIVVRGCRGGCTVEVSADGAAWTPFGSVADGYGTVALDGAPITEVRIGLGADPLPELREVSVWGPLGDVDLDVAPTSGDADDLRSTFGITSSEGARPWWLVAVAGALAAAMLITVGVAIGRRR